MALLYQLFSFTGLLLVKSWSQLREHTVQFLRCCASIILPLPHKFGCIYFTTKHKYVKAYIIVLIKHFAEKVLILLKVGIVLTITSKSQRERIFPYLTLLHKWFLKNGSP